MTQITKRLAYKAMKEKIPVSAGFELTPYCSFSCKMCYVRQEQGKAGAPRPASFWERVAREGVERGLLCVVLTGGETFLYPEFWDLYSALLQMGLQVSINTNGSLITPALCSRLREMKPARVNVTLYGASNASYAQFCNDPQGFDKVRRGVELLAEYGIRFRFFSSLGPDNAADLERMVDFAKSYERDIRVTSYLLPPKRRTGNAGDFDGRLTPEEAGRCTAKAEYLQRSPETFLKLARSRQHFCTLTDDVLEESKTGAPGTVRCQAGRCNAWIDWRGRMGACSFLEEPVYSLDTYSFGEAWDMLTAWAEACRTSPACANCPNRSDCPSCLAAIYGETGTYDRRPEYLCRLQQSAAQTFAAYAQELEQAGYTADQDAVLSQDSCRVESDADMELSCPI